MPIQASIKTSYMLLKSPYKTASGMLVNGLIAVSDGEKWGFMDIDGNFVTELEYEEAQIF